ncbi:group III truncated hemoglobin [Arenimonas caeni]|jgi:hemoglobin|uniref:group III truncated hemoglobin n=1 Tax=Arenimonas caeni TaxID=2058085 RepID=UPI002A35F920|nr:group III truncated hemoglobin [Arenimonas caeni]MDY0021735.1 group III truncated hemoglobin [Arenimonas caeni]
MDETTTLDEAALAGLVDAFYDKVRRDTALGPVFNDAVHDWDEHKRLLTTFWSSVALGTRSYRGNPMAAHQARQDITADHFPRWLALWRETTAERLAPADAERLQGYAERIGESLRYGLGLGRSRNDLGLPIRPA